MIANLPLQADEYGFLVGTITARRTDYELALEETMYTIDEKELIQGQIAMCDRVLDKLERLAVALEKI